MINENIAGHYLLEGIITRSFPCFNSPALNYTTKIITGC